MRLDIRHFQFVKVNLSNAQLDILLDLGLVKLRNKRFEDMGRWKDVQSEKLMRAGD